MSIQITITDPTRDEALRLAEYLFALAGYGKKDGIVSHKFETTPAQVDTQLKAYIESLAARTPVDIVCPALVGTAADVPDETPEGIPADSAGHAWDERIHASSRAVVSDGTWRLRRNLDPAVLSAVLAERDGSSDTPPAPGAWPFPSDATVPPPPPSTATGTDTGTTLAPVTSVGVPPPPPSTATGPLTFAVFMQRVTAAIGAGTIAQTDVAAALGEYGVASIPLLASVHADKIDAVAARLGV